MGAEVTNVAIVDGTQPDYRAHLLCGPTARLIPQPRDLPDDVLCWEWHRDGWMRQWAGAVGPTGTLALRHLHHLTSHGVFERDLRQVFAALGVAGKRNAWGARRSVPMHSMERLAMFGLVQLNGGHGFVEVHLPSPITPPGPTTTDRVDRTIRTALAEPVQC